MKKIDHLLQHIPEIEAHLGYHFQNPALLSLAFIHRSFVNENKEVTEHNERLEFLGDAILGMLIAEYLYKNLPSVPEGELSNLRSKLVEAGSCLQYVQALDVAKYLILGKGERLNDGRGRETIMADLFEAIIGAIFLDGGFEAAKSFLFHQFSTIFESLIQAPLRNSKALLQDFCQRKFQKAPKYMVLEEKGPDHDKIFTIAVYMNDQELGRGTGSSKKEAQQAAAVDALSRCIQKV